MCRQALADARARHEAVADVLRLIGRTARDVPVALEAIGVRVARLCGADFARVYLREGAALVAGPSAPSGFADVAFGHQRRHLGRQAMGDLAVIGRASNLGDIHAQSADARARARHRRAPCQSRGERCPITSRSRWSAMLKYARKVEGW